MHEASHEYSVSDAGGGNRVSDEQLDEIVRRLVKALSPVCVVFFGSHAYGHPRPDSDVDIMIVVSDDAPNRYELSRRAYAALGDIDVPVELHFSRAAQFERFSTVVGSLQREVKRRGRVLYAA